MKSQCQLVDSKFKATICILCVLGRVIVLIILLQLNSKDPLFGKGLVHVLTCLHAARVSVIIGSLRCLMYLYDCLLIRVSQVITARQWTLRLVIVHAYTYWWTRLMWSRSLVVVFRHYICVEFASNTTKHFLPLTFRSLIQTSVRRSLFTSSGSWHGSDVTWEIGHTYVSVCSCPHPSFTLRVSAVIGLGLMSLTIIWWNAWLWIHLKCPYCK